MILAKIQAKAEIEAKNKVFIQDKKIEDFKNKIMVKKIL